VNNITVKLQLSHHANLDSFPFRYRFCSDKDIEIELTNIKEIDVKYIYKPKERYGVVASFKLPNNSRTLRGKFIISKKDNCILTVIREEAKFKTEHILSDTLKELRKSGDICVEDLFEMHDKKIKFHSDVIRFLSDKIGSNKVLDAESSAKKTIEKISKVLQSSREEIRQKDEHIEYLDGVVICAELGKEEADERVIELKKMLKVSEAKNNIFSSLSKTNGHSVKDKYNNYGTDWSKESTTSGVFKAHTVQGDYLVVTLHVAVKNGNAVIREIKCKNTHAGDYERAVEYVKSLKDGDMITYKTRGSGAFGSDWFYKIEKDSQSESESWVNTESNSPQYTSPSSSGLNADDSNFGYYDHDTDFDIDENGNIR
jgi:hypothetical protein